MHQFSQNFSIAQYLSPLNRYSFLCKNKSKNENYKVLSTSFFPLSHEGREIQSVYIVPRPCNHKLPFLAQWIEYQTGELVFIDFPQVIDKMMRKLISLEGADLHDLCTFKLEQLPGIYSQNDLRMELMTKKFQPHLVCIYPVLSNMGKSFIFGAEADNWMFDPLIDALSYRRSAQKATIVFLILNHSVEKVCLSSEDDHSDTVKILQEGIRSGLDIVTPKVMSLPGEDLEISFEKRFFL